MRRPVPILFTIPNFITAGSGRAMLNIVERLDRAKFSPAVCVEKKGGRLDAVVEALGIPFLEAPFTIPAKPYRTLLPRARHAAKPFLEYKFKLWHSFHYLDDYSEGLIARMAGARSIFTKKNMNWGHRAWHGRSLVASRIVAQNSDMMERFFDSSWYSRKTRLIPRGVVTERFHPDNVPQLDLRRRYALPEDAPLIGCIAHLVPVKGQHVLIEALAKVPDAQLLLAGKPHDKAYAVRLRTLAQQQGVEERTHFLDHVENVPAMLAELDLFVMPTEARGEGCPVALLEAMASGTANIATDVPGSRDVVEDGVTGCLVASENPAALATQINRLLQDPALRLQMGAAARQRVLDQYKIEHEVARHEALYGELVT